MDMLSNPYGNMSMQPTMTVRSFQFIASGTYQDLQFRPYQGNGSGSSMQLFMEQTNGGTDVSAATLSGISGNIITPSTRPQGAIQIVNGWNTPRARFVMILEINRSGSKNYQVVSGYTDYVGINFDSKTIDPGMRLHINSVMTLGTNGTGGVGMITDNSHVLFQAPTFIQSMGGFTAPRLNTLMPEDVMSHIGFQAIGGTLAGDGFDGRGQNAMASVIKSNRNNSLATTYLDKTINAYANVFASPDAKAADPYDVTSKARATVRENQVFADPFLQMLRTGANDYSSRGSVSYAELCGLLPGLDSIVGVVDNRTNAQVQGNHNFGTVHAGNFSDWNNHSMDTLFATRLKQAVPTVTMECAMTRMHFKATNMVVDGSECQVEISNVESVIPDINLEGPVRRFVDRLKSEILRDLSMHNQITYSLVMNVNTFGDSMIRLSLNGQPATDYCMPSFGDSLDVPVLAPDSMAINSVAHTIDALVNSMNFAPQMQHNNLGVY